MGTTQGLGWAWSGYSNISCSRGLSDQGVLTVNIDWNGHKIGLNVIVIERIQVIKTGSRLDCNYTVYSVETLYLSI